MHVLLLDYTSGDEKTMAVVRMIDGEMQIEGILPPSLKGTLDFEHEQAKGTDEAFLRKLPSIFSGTYLRARFVAEG